MTRNWPTMEFHILEFAVTGSPRLLSNSVVTVAAGAGWDS